MNAERLEVVKLLTSSVMPLGILTVVVLGVILFGITTATESAGVGAAGAFLLAFQARTLDWKRTKEAVFLTAKTTAMVCWLFVGSALFSAVFAILGGQALVEQWVLSLNMSPVQFMILSQAIIFVLGWPLEWTEIIIIFVPIFLPLLKHFSIDPILWGVLVFVNLQAAFLSPPVAMSAFYLKGVAPKHVTLNQIFAGMMPYMLIVILCMVIMYVWPGMTLWLPNYLYGRLSESRSSRCEAAQSGSVTLTDTELTGLTATDAAAKIASGAIRRRTIRAHASSGSPRPKIEIGAFAHLDPDYAIAQARALDEQRASGRPLGPLHGVPVAIKDIIDTADYPTECGSPVLAGRRPQNDATVVDEAARRRRGHHRQDGDDRIRLLSSAARREIRMISTRTPGGSSSGSAAAVAAGMVPLAHRHADQRLDDPAGRVLRRLRRSSRRTDWSRAMACCHCRERSIMSARLRVRSRTSRWRWK